MRAYNSTIKNSPGAKDETVAAYTRGDAARSPRTPLGCAEASFYAPGVGGMCALLETPRTLRAGELARTLLKQKKG